MSKGSGDPVPSISEAEATGEIAELYADIRATLGVPVVNLIWRNLAVVPNGLQWAWSTARPLYATGAVYPEARALRTRQRLPELPAMPVAALEAAGVDAAGRATIRRIIDSYDRSNPLNLIALMVLLCRLRGETPGEAAAVSASPGAPEPPVSGELPALLALSEMAPATAELVRAVNRLGAGGDDHILVSMPRHLAHWPGYLALYWQAVAPFDADGRLFACIEAVLQDGGERARRLAGVLLRGPSPDAAAAATLEASLEDFTRNAIARMIPVVSLLRRGFSED